MVIQSIFSILTIHVFVIYVRLLQVGRQDSWETGFLDLSLRTVSVSANRQKYLLAGSLAYFCCQYNRRRGSVLVNPCTSFVVVDQKLSQWRIFSLSALVYSQPKAAVFFFLQQCFDTEGADSLENTRVYDELVLAYFTYRRVSAIAVESETSH